jgi:hypothetical protein
MWRIPFAIPPFVHFLRIHGLHRSNSDVISKHLTYLNIDILTNICIHICFYTLSCTISCKVSKFFFSFLALMRYLLMQCIWLAYLFVIKYERSKNIPHNESHEWWIWRIRKWIKARSKKMKRTVLITVFT